MVSGALPNESLLSSIENPCFKIDRRQFIIGSVLASLGYLTNACGDNRESTTDIGGDGNGSTGSLPAQSTDTLRSITDKTTTSPSPNVHIDGPASAEKPAERVAGAEMLRGERLVLEFDSIGAGYHLNGKPWIQLIQELIEENEKGFPGTTIENNSRAGRSIVSYTPIWTDAEGNRLGGRLVDDIYNNYEPTDVQGGTYIIGPTINDRIMTGITDPEEWAKNLIDTLVQLSEHLSNLGAKRVLVSTMLSPTNQWSIINDADGKKRYVESVEIFNSLLRRTNLTVLEFYDLDDDNFDGSEPKYFEGDASAHPGYYVDGLHPNQHGHEVLASKFLEGLIKNLSDS